MTDPALSLQLYTVRDALADDLTGTLNRLASMGLRDVEVYDFVARTSELGDALTAAGLRARTGHASLLSEGLGLDDPALAAAQAPPTQDEVFAAASALGLGIVFDPFVAPERWMTEDDVLDTANRLNAAAVKAADHGLRVGYHNHAQEFIADFGGVSAYEWFVGQLSDEVVLELDLYWAATGKQDIPALLGRLGDRVKALHLKDGVIGENPFVPGAPRLDATSLVQLPAGQGELPLLDYLQAAPATEFGVIEFDHYGGGDIFDGVQASIDFFHAAGLR